LTDDWVIVVDGEGWHRGVIGIAASKLSERFHRPSLVVSREGDRGYGSGRAPNGFQLLCALEHCRDLFDRFGGHAQAVGFQIPLGRLPDLRRRVNEFARSTVKLEDLKPSLQIDAEIRLSDVDDCLFDQIERLSPFGMANPHPLFVAREVSLIAEPRILKSRHLKFRIEQDGRSMDAIGWNMAHQFQPMVDSNQILSLAFTLAQSSFQSMKSLQLIVKDIQLH
jgi:single-stranded-DNA-specific exonuclease